MSKEINIDGTIYVPKGTKEQFHHEGEIKIVVLQRGWIYIGYFQKKENHCTLTKASCIRNWGTTKGLQELVNEKTNKTILDKCAGKIEFDWLTVIHTITVNQELWAGLL